MITYPNAKINIGLNVIEKRSDGFHNIESVFYPVLDLCDVLEVVKNEQGDSVEFTSSGIEIPGEPNANLCVKAYQLLQKDYNLPFVKIHLHKIIPIGAGLGGGSSDAAFMLKILNDLFELNLSNEALTNYAKKLGSDCAFFIENKPVYACNKGDDFKAIELDLSTYQIKVVYPGIHIGTAEAYKGVEPKKSKMDLLAVIKETMSSWRDKLKNDFEGAIFPNHPSVKKLKEKMYQDGAIYASMTGSGSAVFGIFNQ